MKIQLRLSNNDQHIITPIIGINNMLGDGITDLIKEETDSSINPTSDSEVKRILPTGNTNYIFKFWSGSGYTTQIAPLEFTGVTDNRLDSAKNSFYIVQLYDTYKDEVQIKYHTGYYNGYEFTKTSLSSNYIINKDQEFSNIYLPNNVIESMSGITTDYYVKFLFYSAKSGIFYNFYNSTNTGLTTQNDIYYKVSINPNTLKYWYESNTLDLTEITNPNYNARINNTIASFDIQKPNYPTGTTFTNIGTYTD